MSNTQPQGLHPNQSEVKSLESTQHKVLPVEELARGKKSGQEDGDGYNGSLLSWLLRV